MSTGLAFPASVAAAPQTISSERRVAGLSIGALCIILILIIALPLIVLWLVNSATGLLEGPLSLAFDWLKPVEDTGPGIPRY